MRIKNIILFLFLISCENNIKQEKFQLQKGDILFQDLDSSPLCDAIEPVTPGYKKANFSHIGIVVDVGDPFCIKPDYLYNNHVKILEAIPEKVTTTRLDSFLHRSQDKNNNPKVIVGRLKKEYQYTIEDAVKLLKSKIGDPYDHVFLINNNKYYCSELIHDAFKKDEIFKLQPMTFINPETQKTMDVWRDYYKELNMEIPEGKLGINPGIMSLSNKIDIVHIYGYPMNIEISHE
jgi:hypothetical protein